nr:putative hit-like protein [Quercus suber]
MVFLVYCAVTVNSNPLTIWGDGGTGTPPRYLQQRQKIVIPQLTCLFTPSPSLHNREHQKTNPLRPKPPMAPNSIEELYPVSCAFCAIAHAYPSDSSASSSPIPTAPDPEKLSPQCHLLLTTPHVLAFLDIMPIAPGHLLLIPRTHYEKLTDLQRAAASDASAADATWAARRTRAHAQTTARELGAWLPRLSAALSAVTGVEDWNVVQNNGARAAQVVPHVHFHLIPRFQEGRREARGIDAVGDVGVLKSWRMFGRGARQDLDEEEGRELAGLLRAELRKVVGEKGKL